MAEIDELRSLVLQLLNRVNELTDLYNQTPSKQELQNYETRLDLLINQLKQRISDLENQVSNLETQVADHETRLVNGGL